MRTSTMDSVLSLDDGRWLCPAEESAHPLNNELENDFQLGNIRQPSPPPVLAKVQSEMLPICPSKVADPRPGLPKLSQDGEPSSNSYQDLHIPVKMLEDFLRVARKNTEKNLETCGVLAGSLVMLQEAIAIVMAPTDTSSPYGIFHISDPGGVAVIRNCQQRGFHPHEVPDDGSPIYEYCSHVYMNPNMKFDVVDLQ